MQPRAANIMPQEGSPAPASAMEKARMIMQLRNMGIGDNRVLNAIETIPREIFVPEAFRDQAYEDKALPIEMGQTISQPSVVAWMTYTLAIDPMMKVLEVGTGSGYQAAILAKLARRVYSLERHAKLYKYAIGKFKEMNIHNITAKVGDGHKGWPEVGPFQRIIVTAAATEVPHALLEQLDDLGILIIPVGHEHGNQILLRIQRDGDQYHTQHMMPVRFVPMLEGEPE